MLASGVLCELKVIIPHRNNHGVLGIGLLSPQFPRRKPYRVEVLWIFAEALCVGVGEHKYSVVPLNYAYSTSRIARQASVCCRIHVSGADSLARPKLGLNRNSSNLRTAGSPVRADLISC